MSSTLEWRWSPADMDGSLAPGMLTWNVVLYMTVWSVIPSVSSSTRVRWVVVAAPVLAILLILVQIPTKERLQSLLSV